MLNCDTVAPIQWERVCEDLADGFQVDCTGRRYVYQEEEATQPQEEYGESQKRPSPPKSTGKQGDGTPAKAKQIKGRSKPLTAKPQAGIKASTQQGVGHVCSPFHTVPADTKWTWCQWWY